MKIIELCISTCFVNSSDLRAGKQLISYVIKIFFRVAYPIEDCNVTGGIREQCAARPSVGGDGPSGNVYVIVYYSLFIVLWLNVFNNH